ncbi:hypothetical protein COCC4DRAFT_65734 [Bipolaris maydis ATCC 48331]|uniref:Uncharacterized protein n=2 Tax=Cochliobolus heterostrophus TaxID=5016 RepID=M2UBS4_COCH5|nr:uncharacterized protein COCC4DRAFT_65734 [Bipolaris maydis ATCC 48331]EMD85352.1 hypothetical protein COCHEDRAFT_1161482 [Bipolaris maydis C5]ENI00186.1 hypothetical protein COCC4DRAFT_65734 [Bipolaris maydis ATCC 48331]
MRLDPHLQANTGKAPSCCIYAEARRDFFGGHGPTSCIDFEVASVAFSNITGRRWPVSVFLFTCGGAYLYRLMRRHVPGAALSGQLCGLVDGTGK